KHLAAAASSVSTRFLISSNKYQPISSSQVLQYGSEPSAHRDCPMSNVFFSRFTMYSVSSQTAISWPRCFFTSSIFLSYRPAPMYKGLLASVLVWRGNQLSTSLHLQCNKL